MKTTDIFKYAWNGMTRNKKRTFLTFLGIMIGVASFTSIRSLNTGFQTKIRERMTDTFGARTIIVTPKQGYQLYESNVEAIQDMDHVELATGILGGGGVNFSTGSGNSMKGPVMGVNFSEYKEIISSFEAEEGEGEIPDNGNNSIVLGHGLQHMDGEEKFAEIGDEIKVNSTQSLFSFNLTFEATLKETSQMFQMAGNEQAFVHISKLAHELSLNGTPVEERAGMMCKVDDVDNVEKVADDIRSFFEDKSQEVEVLTSQAIISQVNDILDRIAIFLMVISLVALIVAGFGVMNVMLVSVSERTREIGILKSIGATNRTVLSVFLSEALILGITGGLIGIGLGYAGGYLLGQFILVLFENPPAGLADMLVPILTPTTIGISFTISVCISLVFALWPAKRAASFDPVEALRFG